MSALPTYRTGPQGPATHVFAVTPDDSADLPVMPKAIRAAGTGTITLRAFDSTVDVAHPVIAGERIDAVIRAVRATGTDVDVIGYA